MEVLPMTIICFFKPGGSNCRVYFICSALDQAVGNSFVAASTE